MYLNPELPPCDGIKRMDDRLLPSPHITGKELQAEFPHRTQRKAAHKTDMVPAKYKQRAHDFFVHDGMVSYK
ncbi:MULTISPECIES: hypothetical protein [Akkermansia]|jgi:hypothetical protein|uniref:hypothetical protein n=1 Tax=Akkermansia sp. TaxID=1872421 RepID=UPI001C00EC31|nr:hypothetical protein [Candidatus Akkermansia timonensis]MBT8771938.1 hypothetical protein [Akkermansia muciniphila]MBT9561874.1 hypothetical protein [Candidatus Akkermansia timonensis]QWO86572.1 hypothetical protein J5W67_02505 [Candidatus Akkermansia timonensis]QWO90799.1 hypothetical protein J5W64_13205 [Candidatus Akkermansia timonensis]QWO93843.1 hypothetical protein J5W56_02335 [Candidatus Akkermansia timonensis]